MWGQDEQYASLMRELWGAPSKWAEQRSYAQVAKKLIVDEETVRYRIKKMKQSGFLTGWRLLPNPSILGMKWNMLLAEFPDAESKDSAVESVAKGFGTILVANLFDRSAIITYFDNASGRSAEAVGNAVGGQGGKATKMEGIRQPDTDFTPSRSEWRIIMQLLRDGEMRAEDVAAGAGVAARTVRRRVAAMLESRAAFFLPVVDLRKVRGVPYQFIVGYDAPSRETVNAMVSARISGLIFTSSQPDNTSIFGFNATNVGDGNELLKWAQGEKLIRSARLSIVENVIHVYDWLEDEVSRLSAGSR